MNAIVELIEKLFDKYFLGSGTSSIRPENEVANLIRNGAFILDVREAFEAKKGLERRHTLPDLARDVERGLGPIRRHEGAAAARELFATGAMS